MTDFNNRVVEVGIAVDRTSLSRKIMMMMMIMMMMIMMIMMMLILMLMMRLNVIFLY